MNDTQEEISAAYQRLLDAAEEYGKIAPKREEPKGKPKIEPKLLHTSPDSFRLGYNMMLDAGGYMGGKIPVVVVPVRREDIIRYRASGCSIKQMKILGLINP